MRILAVIPARGGSKGLPGKNLRLLAGKPLLVHSVDVARACPWIDEVVVTSDSDEIGKVAREFGAVVVHRPRDLAQDATPMEPVVQHALLSREKEVEPFDAVLLLQPTSPLRSRKDLEESIRLFSKSPCDTLLSVYPFHGYRYHLKEGIVQPMFQTRGNRQDREEEYVENGAIYLTRAELVRSGRLFGERLSAYVMPTSRSVDIDTADDLLLAQALLTSTTHT
ncbi:acylneuraminate cytidylyltransferase family protein [Candidatus Uhrbacteria bacterium]|nr:acylneuraminate cytidylyltransferase family protein [Candidatus Uhrbacteria bacterium]